MAEDKTNTQTVEELGMAFETENPQGDTVLETNFNQFERVRDHELEELARMKRERTVGKGLITVVSEKLFPTKTESLSVYKYLQCKLVLIQQHIAPLQRQV